MLSIGFKASLGINSHCQITHPEKSKKINNSYEDGFLNDGLVIKSDNGKLQ